MKYNWNRLDNAAKIFPSARGRADNQVFRFSCELMEEVKPVFLQQALDETVAIFEVFQYTLKRGLFWYYLEEADQKPVVREEYKPPCSAIYYPNRKSLLYEVTYYKNRINFEVFHALSDGTGAMHFLRTLVIKYLTIAHSLASRTLDFDASYTQMAADSFQKYYSAGKKKNKQRQPSAYQIRGVKLSENRISVITGVASVKQVLQAAHDEQTTLTGFLSACLMLAIDDEMPERAKKKPVVLSVPVNLRKYFPSDSARNFFSLIFVRYLFNHKSTLPEERDKIFKDVVRHVNADLEKELQLENLSAKIDLFASIERNIFARIAPLPLKDICLKAGYHFSSLSSTATISNIGVVSMPKDLWRYIYAFHVFNSTNKLQICICSFADQLSMNFTAPFLSVDIQKRFFRELTKRGIQIELTTNLTDT